MDVINTSGRRKNAVARLYMSKGKGEITINKRDYKDYFPTGTLQYTINQAFNLTETAGKFNIKVNVSGIYIMPDYVCLLVKGLTYQNQLKNYVQLSALSKAHIFHLFLNTLLSD